MSSLKYKNKFKDICDQIKNFESFEKIQELNKNDLNNQLFSKKIPPFDLVRKIVNLLMNHDNYNDNINDIYFEFTKKNIVEKNCIERFLQYKGELKKYYLKCKHEKYLENLTTKKFITLLRQIIRPYDYSIKAYEKYENGKKFLLYVIDKNKDFGLKKINSIISFD